MENLTRKILFKYLTSGCLKTGEEIGIHMKQVYIEDHSGVQVILHCEAMKLDKIKCELGVCYVDHNILPNSEEMEAHTFLRSACSKYGLWYSKSASGICHQVHVENFAVPGVTILGANSHTPHCGGIGALSFGVGGMELANSLAGKPYFLIMPKVVNIRVEGKLNEWCSAKDISLELLRRLTVQGGHGKIFEFTGPGIRSLNVQQRMTLTHMCVELGALTGIFPSDDITYDYYRRLNRESEWVELKPDENAQYDDIINLDLSEIEPLVSLPGHPDHVVPARMLNNIKVQQVMVGSCTSGSFMDISYVAQIVMGRTIHPEVSFIIQPSSKMVLKLLADTGLYQELLDACVEITPPSCDACVGIGYVPGGNVNSLRAFSRNFQGRSGCKNDSVYLCSAQTAAVSAIEGRITDPHEFATKYGLDWKKNDIPYYPQKIMNTGLIPPLSYSEMKDIQIIMGNEIFPTPLGIPLNQHIEAEVFKLGDFISTDQIIPNGIDIKAHRSNIAELSKYIFYRLDKKFNHKIENEGKTLIVAGENYGQGSARENAAIIPSYLGVRGVIAKSFSTIYHNNMVNFGLIPLIFCKKENYDDIDHGDKLIIDDLIDKIDDGKLFVFNKSKGRKYEVYTVMTQRQKKVLKAGGMLRFNLSNI